MKIKHLALAIATLGSFTASAQINHLLTFKTEKADQQKNFGKADSKSLPQYTTHVYWNSSISDWEYPSNTQKTYDDAGNILITLYESYSNGNQDTFRTRVVYTYNSDNREISSFGINWNNMQRSWDSSSKSFSTYDAFGHQTTNENYYMNGGVWEFTYGFKSTPTYGANNRLDEEVNQDWVSHLGAYRNSYKAIYGYTGQNVINELIQFEWDTLTSVFIKKGRITNIVWYKYEAGNVENSKVSGFTFQDWIDPNYVDVGRSSQLYDIHDNETEYKNEDKVDNAWVVTSETTNTLTYNSQAQLTQKVISGRYAPQPVFTKSDKYDYSNFRIFSGLRVNDFDANAVTLFPNPMTTTSTLKFMLPVDFTNSYFILYNILGEEVYTTPVTSTKTTIERSDLPLGIYSYQIVSNGSIGLSGKLIIE
ncbi:MAG: T9SS type A sorting domain-containing protein [Bacteroidia bacterium]|jgi:hypothetical protein